MKDINELAKAFVAFQADLQPVTKSATNPFFKSSYAPLNEVMESIQPLLAKHKLAISQFITNLNGESALQTVLIHESGQSLEYPPQPLLLVKNDPQSQGSATTYARRYGIMAVLGAVADDDDDGNKASKREVLKPLPKKVDSTQRDIDEYKIKIGKILNVRGTETQYIPDYIKKEYGIDVHVGLTLDQAKVILTDLESQPF